MDEDRPYGHNTLKLPAIFIPDGNPDNISTADILRIIGPHAVMIRAIFTPDGSDAPPPGYPWVELGPMTLPPKKGPTETPSTAAPRPGARGGTVAASASLSGEARTTLAGDRFAETGELTGPLARLTHILRRASAPGRLGCLHPRST
jgi:hypothetical protein